MNIDTLRGIIRNNINDLTADVDDSIDLGIKFMSNFFNIKKLDSSQTVSTGDTSLDKPARCLKVLSVKIGDAYIKKADLDKLQDIEDDESQRWYTEDDFIADTENKIHLTEAISVADNGGSVVIIYVAGFVPLAGVAGAKTDLPERLEPLLTSFCTYFYYGILVSYVKNFKAEFPNMTLWDVIAIWDTWRIHSFDLLKITQKQHFNL